MALHSLYCADVPLRSCSLTHLAPCEILLKTDSTNSLVLKAAYLIT